MKIAHALSVALVSAFAFAPPAAAAVIELIANGGFEMGLVGWTRADRLGSDGAFFLQTGSSSPVNGLPVPAPPEGSQAVMTDAEGPGSHVLYQDFMLAAPVPLATLSFRVFVNNTAQAFFTPATLEPFLTPASLNQQARVDITLGTDPFSVASADVLLNAFQTAPGDPLTFGYLLHSIDVTSLLNAHVGESLRLRFAEADNVSVLNFGVDDVRLTVSTQLAAIPEPASGLLVLTALLAMALAGGRRIGAV